jgi:hypothetical protein
MVWSVRQGIELFHLAFLSELGTRLDKGRYAIKGGCNLRFFFHSPRYSEDLDVDVAGVQLDTLKRNVTRVLESRSLRLTLGAAGIQIGPVSLPKQTETTQRWKLALDINGVSAHTKLEFSRRGLDPGVDFEQADPALVAAYGLTPLILSHYGRSSAITQKVRALVGRAESQARDVFDLDLLLQGYGGGGLAVSKAQCRAAIERAQAIDHGTFKAQVVAFLPPHQQAAYADSARWRQISQRVVGVLEGIES